MRKSLSLLLTFFLFTIKLNAIENISINRETLVPDFSKETRVYNVYVLSSTEIITINATGEENELITGTGSKSLKKGLNVFEINSYINDILTESYTLNITRGEDVFDNETSILEDLSITGYNIDFKSDNFNYEISLNEDEDLEVIYKVSNPKMNVKVSETNDLITIKVISENKKNESVYKVKINKEVKVNAVALKSSFFDKKKFDKFELKIIRISIISVVFIIMSVLFYLIFVKYKKKKNF